MEPHNHTDTKETNNRIKENVLGKIRRGDVHMRPKLYFVAQVIVVTIVAIITLAVSVFAVSFIFFSIHESGELFLFGFGMRGLLTFIAIFPWFTSLLALSLIILFEWLLRHFKFNYRRSILSVFFGLFCVVGVVGVLISITPIHKNLLDQADHGHLPFIGESYENIHTPHENNGEFRGVIISISTSTITISHNDNDADTDDGVRTILVPLGFDISTLHIGDRMYVAGDMASDTVSAYGLQKF
jgi:hypothetical protein